MRKLLAHQLDEAVASGVNAELRTAIEMGRGQVDVDMYERLLAVWEALAGTAEALRSALSAATTHGVKPELLKAAEETLREKERAERKVEEEREHLRSLRDALDAAVAGRELDPLEVAIARAREIEGSARS